MTIAYLSAVELRKAVTLRERIDALQIELARLLGESRPGGASPRGSRKGRLSPAARARIAAAQRKRWALHRRLRARKQLIPNVAKRRRFTAVVHAH